jgi:hypothetical protein
VLFVVLLAGCRVSGSFPCTADEQCRRGGDTGVCGPAGFCGFVDGQCSSGFRYDDTAAAHAGMCVEPTTPMPDAEMIDTAPPFDITTCPATYTQQIASTMTTSRYRLITSQAMFTAHASNCDDDMQGATHLVFPETVQEIIELSQWIDPLANTGAFFFVGVVQARDAASPGAGWILFDDTPVSATVWRIGEPDDGDGAENNTEQLANFDKTPSVRRMSDGNGISARGAVCECDGKKYGPIATAILSEP